MKLTAFLAAAFAFSALAEDAVNWQFAGTKPLVLQGWGTVRDQFGLARFSQKSNSLSIELAGGGTEYGHCAPAVLQEVSGDFEATIAIQPGINPEGKYATANRALWNSAGLIVELGNNDHVRLELSILQPTGKKPDNRIWAQRIIGKTNQWHRPSVKDANTTRPLFLRMQRTGSQLKWAYTFDKEKWTELEPFETKDWPSQIKVGVHFINVTTKMMKATVSDFKITKASDVRQ